MITDHLASLHLYMRDNSNIYTNSIYDITTEEDRSLNFAIINVSRRFQKIIVTLVFLSI